MVIDKSVQLYDTRNCMRCVQGRADSARVCASSLQTRVSDVFFPTQEGWGKS